MKKLVPLTFALFCFLGLEAQITKVEGTEAMIIRQKSTCGTTESGKTRFGMWEGRAYNRVTGEKDKHLFNLLGINTRQCRVEKDDVRGIGFKSISREIMVYLDLKTNEIMDIWENPWTDEKVEVVHVANDPVNMRGMSWTY